MTGTLTNSANVHVTGKVGIGTSAPQGALHVKTGASDSVLTGAILGNENVGASTGTSLDFRNHTTDTVNTARIIAQRTTNANSNSTLQFWNFQNGSLQEAMRINGAGNIGVGTAEPTYKLDVAGDIVLDNGNFLGRRLSGGLVAKMLSYNSNKFEISEYSSLPDKVIIYTPTDLNQGVEIYSNKTIAYFRNDGNVGIGTNAPGQKLEVVGGVKAVTFESTASTGTAPLIVACWTATTGQKSRQGATTSSKPATP
jgi:hypothetical protein